MYHLSIIYHLSTIYLPTYLYYYLSFINHLYYYVSVIYQLSIYCYYYISSISGFITRLWPCKTCGTSQPLMRSCFFYVGILKSESRQSGREDGWEVRESRTTGSSEDERWGEPLWQTGTCVGPALPPSLCLVWWQCPAGEVGAVIKLNIFWPRH